jgi:hypothetical protein
MGFETVGEGKLGAGGRQGGERKDRRKQGLVSNHSFNSSLLLKLLISSCTDLI